jgi:hypothetical protein
MPGKTPARYPRIGIFSRRQVSTMEAMAATFGPASLLPTWIQFFRLSKYFDSRNYVHSRIMCSRPRSNWRASLAQRGFAGLAHTWTNYLGPADCP